MVVNTEAIDYSGLRYMGYNRLLIYITDYFYCDLCNSNYMNSNNAQIMKLTHQGLNKMTSIS